LYILILLNLDRRKHKPYLWYTATQYNRGSCLEFETPFKGYGIRTWS